MKNTITTCFIFIIVQFSTGAILYVNASAAGNNDGSSWTNGFIYLQDALAAADVGDEIWVAEGIYKPDRGIGLIAGDRTASFALKSGVALYGGFVGIETSLEQRNWWINETILSGDLIGDDRAGFTNISDNSYRIVNGGGVDTTSILDGFTITGGNANTDYPYNVGGGLHIHTGSPKVINCTFTRNWASNGGSGAWITSSDSAFSNCSFIDNYSNYYAGAFYAYSGCLGSLENCTFIGNTAANNGGAVRIRASTFSVNNCTFTSNVSQTGGGGIVIAESAYATVNMSTFTNNRGIGRGGAIFVDSSSEAIVQRCNFVGNAAPYGGAIRCSDAQSITIHNCIFKKNGSNWGITCFNGGAFYSIRAITMRITNSFFLSNVADSAGGLCLDGNPGEAVVANCVFAGNIAGTGGGIRVYNCTTDITNCTFYGNTASTNNQGRSLAVQTTGLLKSINNSILWEGGNEIYGDNGTFTVDYSNLEGSWTGRGQNNISADPYFIFPEGIDGVAGTEDDEYQLYGDSPCIDAGSNSLIPDGLFFDLKGDARIGGLIVDMGAYENMACGDAGFPFPTGDLNYDCRIDFQDLNILATNWLVCTDSDCDK